MKKLIYFFLFLLLLSSCQEQNEKKTEIAPPEKTNVEKPTPSIQKEFNNDSISEFWNRDLSKNGDFYKVTFPRMDIQLKIDGEEVNPGLAYTSWIAYWPVDEGVRIMGDMVLLDTEIPKVIPYMNKNGIDITAIHNHLLREQPRLVYMHFAAEGKAMKLSKVMKGAYELTSTSIEAKEQNENIKKASYDWSGVKEVLGKNASEKGDLLKFSFPREGDIKMGGRILPKTFGIATGIGFQALGGKKAAVTGDFVLKEDEVNQVIDALSKNNIEVTALHNHMLHEEPDLYYMHFWAVGNSIDLAKGIKEALEKTNVIFK